MIFSISALLHHYELTKIFTPSTVAKINYVNRNQLENQLIRDLYLPGKQIILYGQSGCGKTTLLQNILSQKEITFTKVSCTLETTFESLILSTLDNLNLYYKEYTVLKNSTTRNADFETEFELLKNSLSYQHCNETEEQMKRIVPVQLSIERLASFLGQYGIVWIIEDFHKVQNTEKKKLAQVLKVFMDKASEYSKVKIICIGAVNSAREMLEFDPELNNRVSEIEIPRMSTAEIKELVVKGFKLMNVKPHDSELIDKIVYFSNNISSIAHQLCYDICYNKNINNSKFKSYIFTNNDFLEAVKSFSQRNSDTYRKFSELISIDNNLKRVANSVVDKGLESFHPTQILTGKNNNFTTEYKRELLLKLSSDEYGNLIKYTDTTDIFYISNPYLAAHLRILYAKERAEKQNKKHYELYSDNFSELNEIVAKVIENFTNQKK